MKYRPNSAQNSRWTHSRKWVYNTTERKFRYHRYGRTKHWQSFFE